MMTNDKYVHIRTCACGAEKQSEITAVKFEEMINDVADVSYHFGDVNTSFVYTSFSCKMCIEEVDN